MFDIDPKSIADTRIQLHWASQLLSAAADATLEKADDDSHSNLGWDADRNELFGRSGCKIEVPHFQLIYQQHVLEMNGKTLTEARTWLSDKLSSNLSFRDYEMPPHAVTTEAPFSIDGGHLQAIASWLTFGQQTFTDQGELRVWPHHFDMGFWVPGSVAGRSIGGGLSLGDHHYQQPYFYLNPYGIDRLDDLPALPSGHWTPHWFGAVLTFAELSDRANPADTAAEFVAEAIRICRSIIDDGASS